MREVPPASGPQALPEPGVHDGLPLASRFSDPAARLADELREARADRDLAEAETRSLIDHHRDLRAELLRLQALVEAAAAERSGSRTDGASADGEDVAAVKELDRIRAQLDAERAHGQLEAQRLQGELAGARRSLAEAEGRAEDLARRHDAILASRSWRIMSPFRRIVSRLRPA